MTVRPATADEEGDVLDLIDQLFAAPGTRPPGYTREHGARRCRYALESADADLLLAIDGGQVVGLASVYREFPSIRFGRRCWLEDLVVAADRRGRGVGRLLLDAASEWGRARGCTLLGLSSAAARRDAHRFYVTNGMAQSQHFTRVL